MWHTTISLFGLIVMHSTQVDAVEIKDSKYVTDFNLATFNTDVIGGNGFWLVDFWRPACGPCM
jgi:thioredoxin-like negative regulator of GroEL